MALEVLAEYFIIQKEYGPKLTSFIGEKLGFMTVIEHFDNFYRFQLESNISIGAVFGLFEDEVNYIIFTFILLSYFFKIKFPYSSER